MIELSERLKGKTEFFCGSCQNHKPIDALGIIKTTPKREVYTCNSCCVRRSANVRIPSRAKIKGVRISAILKNNVAAYITHLNLKE